jgi:hypothetical protein
VAGSEIDAATGVLDSIVSDDSELVTVVAGSDASDDVTTAIEEHLAAHHDHVEVTVVSGGQPLYPYLFGVE